jgi:hypothetical protein
VTGVCQQGKTASEQPSDNFCTHVREGKQKHNPELVAILIAKIVMTMRVMVMGVVSMRPFIMGMFRMRPFIMCVAVMAMLRSIAVRMAKAEMR